MPIARKPTTATKTTKPKTTKPTNDNIASFVDAVTPVPVIIQSNYLDMTKLAEFTKKATDEQKTWIQQMVEIVLSANKQEDFLSFGEKVALNSLRKLNILV
jgi:hypothetical protein